MSDEWLAPLGFAALFAMILCQVPIGLAMAIVGVVGYAAVVGLDPAMSVLASTPLRTASDTALTLLPLFILMTTPVTGWPGSYPAKVFLTIGLLSLYLVIAVGAWRALTPMRLLQPLRAPWPERPADDGEA